MKKIFSYFVVLTLVVYASFSLSIVLTGKAYPDPDQQGNDIHRVHNFDLPESFFELESYFENESGDFKALLIPPPGRGIEGYWRFDNKTVVETSYLINQFVPIPLISGGSPLGDLAVDYTSSISLDFMYFTQLTNVRYIIINRYWNPSAEIERYIKELSEMTKVRDIGNFIVYRLNESLPLMYTSTNVVYVPYESLREFFDSVFLYLRLRGYELNEAFPLVFLSESLPEAENLTITQLQSLFESVSLSSANLYGKTLSLDLTNTIRVNESYYGHYLGNLSIPTSSLVYLECNFRDLDNRAWRNVVINGENQSIFVQIYLNHDKPSVNVLSIQEYLQSGLFPSGAPDRWNNILLGDIQGDGSYKVVIFLNGEIIDVRLELNSKTYVNKMTLENPISNPKLSFMGVGTSWEVNYSVFNSSDLGSLEAMPSPDTSISWEEINSTKYSVTVNSLSNETFIIFNQNYDQGWALESSGSKDYDISHYKVNGYANGWHIRSEKPINDVFTITYEPQKFHAFGWWSQVVLFLISFVIFCVTQMVKIRKR